MRRAFFTAVEGIARSDGDTYLLTGDLGYGLFDSFRENHPGRFIDAGVAEQNMVGLAAGLALCGKKAYCYSIAPFITMRAYEQIRMDIAYPGLPVKLVGVGGGFTYGLEGFSHFGIEDLSLMRSLPNMDVVAPADPVEASLLAMAADGHGRPLYIRLGKSGDPVLHRTPPRFEIGKGIVLSEGSDAVVFATGSMVYQAWLALAELAVKGVSATLVNMHTLKPLDRDLVFGYASSHRAVFTVEEHSVAGGLGSAVAEALAESSYDGTFRRIGIPDVSVRIVGDADHLKDRHGLTARGISGIILDELAFNNLHRRGRHGLEGALRGLPQAVQGPRA